jgi:hypothetical protein
VVLFGTPTRFGNPASQLRAFIDTTGVLWYQGRLADKVYSACTASNTAHGGQESTILALGNTFYHWGGIIVPPGYTDPVQLRTGNPYGTSHVAADGPPDDVALEGARRQAMRAVDTAPHPKPAAPPNPGRCAPVRPHPLRQRITLTCLTRDSAGGSRHHTGECRAWSRFPGMEDANDFDPVRG